VKSLKVLVFAYAFHLICGIVYEPEPEADTEIGKVLKPFIQPFRPVDVKKAQIGSNTGSDSTKNLFQRSVRLVKIG